MSLPIGMHRRAFSYDDALDSTDPMSPPPSDMCSNVLWKQPVIPERKYKQLSKIEEGETLSPPSITPSSSNESISKVPVVKAKATSIMNSLITKQTQESMQRFEQQAGLRDAGYTPHKGLTAEETKYHRVAEALHKLKMQSGEATKDREEKANCSAHSSASNTPCSSPKHKPRGWFNQRSISPLPGSECGSIDTMSGDRGSADKWSIFGPLVQKSSTDPGGFTVQSYKGAQKLSPMELIRTQTTRMAEDPSSFKAPKMDIPLAEGKKAAAHAHNLKHRDMNILTPTGF
ncbi:putative monooxygenase p33MONOX [Microcaecilia unicolor]|uniref:Putative monooxygenase p33MONOX n=1 Tax=Microcaecilia unicolor TaxID=1415580 RepID=A0A6P7YUW0_9AMPH|nr:putative monooxygenase p33MONOX [Microcaecilia unicolor]XP_030067049.1 putative monooxygenase p33MONOX [Microcaecilia unicolor]XP_030067050.1 putative monooxygenase p33MONOX [Microcaecilia unicolor]